MRNWLYDYWKQYKQERDALWHLAIVNQIDTIHRKSETEFREEMVRKYAYAIPDEHAIYKIRELSPIIEIGAGLGYWARLIYGNSINDTEGDIICYDLNPPDQGKNEYHEHRGCYYPVKDGSAEKILYHKNRTLFLCWPPVGRLVEECLRLYEGNKIIYIGEDGGRCNELDEKWEIEEKIYIPCWSMMKDRMTILKRKQI